MRFCSMSVSLVTLCLGSLAGKSFAELTVTRQPPRDGGKNYTFTCVSEDDRSALVWNYDLHVLPLRRDDKFLPVRPSSDLNCAITEGDTCIAKWENTGSWEPISSVDSPMGPVFDYRWENFADKFFSPEKDNQKHYDHVIKVPRSGAVVFSAHGLGDIDLQLREKNLSLEIPCFTFTIAASPHRKSKIYSNYHKMTDLGYKAPDESIVNASEWRTFTLEWDEELNEVRVYSDAGFDYRKFFTTWINVNHLFIRSNDAGRLRFHFYEYLKTTANNAELISSRIDYSQYNYCMELLVGLCAECQLDVAVIHPNHATEHIETISGSPPLHGVLPTWKIVKINATLSNENDSHFYLKLVTKLKPTSDDGLWAIDSIRKCKSSDDVRKSTITVQRTTTSSPFPKIGCQRLRYDSHATVDTGVPATDKLAKGLSKCNRGKLGPCCTLARNDSCKGSTICQSSGCFCAPGFRGDNCTDYDVNDMEIRHYCKHGTYNFRTGFCDRGCVGHYMPPACTIELSEPRITYVTASKAGVDFSVPVNTGNLRISYHLKPLQPGNVWQRVTSTRHPDIPLVFYTLYLTGLSASTTYTLGVIVTTAKGSSGVFPDIKFTTPCKVPNIIDFKVASEGNGVVVLSADSTDGDVTAYEVQIVAGNKRLKNKQASGKTLFVERLTRQSTQFPLKVYLSTATDYQFYVTAEKACGRSYPQVKEYQVKASLGFTEGDLIVNRSQASIKLRVPSIVNETDDTVLNVIVKGPPPCGSSPVPGDLRKLLNMTESDQGWLAKNYTAGDNRTYLIIGNDTDNDNSGICTLDRYGTYIIVVVAIDSVDQVTAVLSSLPSKPTETPARTDNDPNQHNFVWLLLLLILIISFCLIFLWRRKFQNIYERMKTPAVHDGDNISLATIGTPSLDWPFGSCPHPVKLKKFEESVKRFVENGELESQFTMLPRGLMQPCQYGSLRANRHKNKYKNIVAYDETRVILTTNCPGSHDDYINANYIQGYCKDQAYIATQGPKSETLVDFWRMIWQEEVRIICMLVNVVEGGKKMCEQYWPEIGKSVEHGGIAIMNIKQRVYAHYTYRTFQLTKDHETESRKVEHLQYTGWPEQGVPMYCHSIVEYLNELRATPPGPGPIVVHCNAGVGRTGTLILSDICLDYTAAEGTLDLFAEAKKMFHARANMLDNLQQYILAHLMPTQCLLLLPTKLPCSDVSLDTIEKLKKDLTIHIRRLAVSSWKDKALYPSEPLTLPNPDHMAKNRFPAFIPVEHSLVSLEPYPPDDSDSEYISAVSVDGVKSKGLYLASQLPLPSTLPDFWRLVAEKRVEFIVILQRPGPEGLDCVDVVPQETHFYPVPYITVENTMCTDYQPHFTTDKLLLVDTSENEAVVRNVTVLTCNNWSLAEDSEPPPSEALVALWSASERVSRTDQGPTLVLCHDGVTGCGLYLALSIILERMAVEQECDVILAARVVRRSRPDFVCLKKQFEYLYDAALEFMQTFKNYDNFA